MNPNGKPTLKDVDGTVPGKVQLVAIELEEDLNPRTGMQHSYFEEGKAFPNPWRSAEGLKLSIESDWPQHHWTIVGNWRARYLKWVQRQQEMGFLPEDAWSPQEYLDTFK